MKETSIETLKRFIDKVDIRSDDECWLWRGSKFTSGYGQFILNNHLVRAHRVAYFLRHKKLPLYNTKGESLVVCHHCDNPPCCNPSHLFLGTHLDNARDSVLKGRRGGQFGKQGPRAILTNIQVWKIRLMLSKKITQEKIAECFGIARRTISDIKTGKSWSHLKKMDKSTQIKMAILSKGGDKTVNTTIC